uniref:Uncharacterized protein n=1 Tax=Candidatus Kentrum sp. LPFa TaxID=2126335 RepID=A0A450VZI3_9GAMM|nr:MAG: hypothetical protein BECKLPF1236B_GA0070989_10133 [Candidatus Kentron sp. LPFa]
MEHEHLNVHEETERNIPQAESSPVLWRFLVWGLPGEALTVASIVVFACVSIVSLHTPKLRQLFAFPFERPVTIGVLCVIFLLALWLVFVVSGRPGKLWPRLWAFFSAVIPASLIAGFLLVEFRLLDPAWTPPLSAFSLASFSSLTVLYLRRLPLGPDSRWLRPIGPLALVVGLTMGSVGTWQFSGYAVAHQEVRIDEYLARLDEIVKKQEPEHRELMIETSAWIEREQMVSPPSPRLDDIGPDLDLRRVSRILGREGKLDGKLRGVMQAAIRSRAMVITDTARNLAAIREYDWSSVETRLREARSRIEALGRLNARVIGEPHLWRDAATLGMDGALMEGYQSLLRETARAFESEHLPRLSQLSDPQIRWDPDRKRWIENKRFNEAASITADYFRQLGRFWMALAPVIDSSPRNWMALQREHSQFTTQIQDKLTKLRDSWEDRWSLAVLPREIRGDVPMDLVSFLKMPMIPIGEDRIAPSDFGRLLQAKLGAVWNHAKGDDRCATQQYEEKGRQYHRYHRLDCSAYRIENNSKPARLWFQYRLVYQSVGRKSSQNDLPAEIYLLFPVQTGKKTETFADSVLLDLSTAVSDTLPGGWYIASSGRGGSYAEGFKLKNEDQYTKVVVYRPKRIKLIPNMDALEIRAERK